MDTTEELTGYFFAGMHNISAGELFLWVMVDETMKQLGVDDAAAILFVLAGRNDVPTRKKPKGAIPNTSKAAVFSRRIFPYELPFPLPTLVGGPIKGLKVRMVNNLGAFVGRTVPVVGWVILAYDVSQISYKTVIRYNKIARGHDKLWG